jgi:Nif-specific regulatory protein
MPSLTVRERGRPTYTVGLDDAELTVGREACNRLVLADDQASRRHARLFRDGAVWTVADLGSTHGTLVNGKRVERAPLGDGDVIQIGATVIAFAAADEPELAVRQTITAVQPPPRRHDEDGRRLELLYQISQAIGALSDPDELVARVLDTVLELLDGERGVVGLGADGSARRVARSRRGATGDVVVSRTLVATMTGDRHAVSVSAETGAPVVSMVAAGVRAAIGAPLIAGARVLGFIYVDARGRERAFNPAELDFLVALSHLAAAALDQAEQRQRDRDAAAALRADHPTDDIVGDSPPMRTLKMQLGRFAAGELPVLVRGESGTGKELVARGIHARSPRAEGPFVAINCAAIPETMIESELFGHDKGAFTGAQKARPGRFAQAHRGTLFLDEIGDLSLAGQAKVLRAIELGEILPLGADDPKYVDVRIVAATHKSLEKEVAAGRFREDLFYRLDMAGIEVPPLRVRGEDIERLAELFAARAARRVGRGTMGFTAAAMAALRAHSWPGNVRQLQNEVERAVILSDGGAVGVEQLRVPAAAGAAAAPVAGSVAVAAAAPVPVPASVPAAASVPAGGGGSLADQFRQLDLTERHIVEAALRTAGGSVAKAARILEVGRGVLRRRAAKFGLTSPDEGPDED